MTQLMSRFQRTQAPSTTGDNSRAAYKSPYALPLGKDDCLMLLAMSYRETVESRGGTFSPTPRMEKCLSKVASFLTDPGTKWGMIYSSVPGCGKTTMVRAIQRLLNVLRLKDVQASESEYRKAGLRMVDARLVNKYYEKDPAAFSELQNASMLAVDDLGVETKANMSYGQLYFPMNELIEYRYSRQLFTVITTNMTGAEIKERYGDRFNDRLKEMMERVNFGDGSFRK